MAFYLNLLGNLINFDNKNQDKHLWGFYVNKNCCESCPSPFARCVKCLERINSVALHSSSAI